MERDSTIITAPIVAATLTAALFSKVELPANADPSQEILRIYRKTLHKLLATKPAELKAEAKASPTG